jgi:hypothetical protein
LKTIHNTKINALHHYLNIDTKFYGFTNLKNIVENVPQTLFSLT